MSCGYGILNDNVACCRVSVEELKSWEMGVERERKARQLGSTIYMLDRHHDTRISLSIMNGRHGAEHQRIAP